MKSGIYKQPVLLGPVQTISLPSSARIVYFGRRPEDYYFWYSFEEKDTILVDRHFSIVGTGHLFPSLSHHRGTCFDGPYVWHLIELPHSQENS